MPIIFNELELSNHINTAHNFDFQIKFQNKRKISEFHFDVPYIKMRKRLTNHYLIQNTKRKSRNFTFIDIFLDQKQLYNQLFPHSVPFHKVNQSCQDFETPSLRVEGVDS